MAVAVLRRYQGVSPFTGRSVPDACRNVIGILLNGMVRHASSAASEDFDAFADRINSLAESIETKTGGTPENDLRQMVLTAHSAVEVFEEYTIQAARHAADRENDLREVIVTLAEGFFALAELAPVSGAPGAPERLAGLRQELRSAADIQSLRKLKSRLAESVRVGITARQEKLNEARPETPKAAGQEARTEPRQEIRTEAATAKDQTAPGQSQPSDESIAAESITGESHAVLSQRKAAEEAIRNSLSHAGRKFVVTVVMDGLPAINQRYGNEVGDKALKELGIQLQRYLTSTDRLYRWTGPAWTALVHREESIDYMRAMIKRIFDPPPQKDFEIAGRKVSIPLSAVWSVVALIPPVTNIYSYIDRFVSSQKPRELV